MATQPAFVATTRPVCDVAFTDPDGEVVIYSRPSWGAAQNLIGSVAAEVSGCYPISHQHALGLLADRGYRVTADGEVLA